MTHASPQKKRRRSKGHRRRYWHRLLAPILLLPLGFTTLTGVLYQWAEMAGAGDQSLWLLDLHKGVFGPFDLQRIYPFVNAIGFLALAGTGIAMLPHAPRLGSALKGK